MTNLLDAIGNEDNLWLAWRQVARKKSAPGIDGVSVPEFSRAPEKQLRRLGEQMRRGTYQPLPLRGVWIPKRDGGWRKAGAPTVRDRIAQRAWLQVLSPVIDGHFANSSHAYRPARSIHTAIAQVEFLRDSGRRVVLESDVADCFDSIDRDLLLQTLKQYVSEAAPVELARRWMETGTVWSKNDDLPLLGAHGLAQGDLVSPLLCNVFLDGFDVTLWDSGFRLVRYADDFVILTRRRAGALAAYEAACRILANLGLQLNPRKTRLTTFEQGFEYLGALFVGNCVLPLHKRETQKREGWRSTRYSTGYEEKPLCFNAVKTGSPTVSGGDALASALHATPHAPQRASFETALQGHRATRRRKIAQQATTCPPPRETVFLI